MDTDVHRVRFYNPSPRSINASSLNKSLDVLALSREDASIEIWDISHAPLLLKVIPGVENGSVEALGWIKDRLVSTGMSGALIEWDLEKLTIKSSVLLTGYVAWCLDVNKDNTLIAVGTEQGYINLFSCQQDFVYEKLFDKQEGRIICCKFDKSGKTLVTGSINSIRVWDVTTGHATARISTKRRGSDILVWSLAVLSDLTVVSGDSFGRLSFWDGNLGEHLETFTTHKADILSIAVSDDETQLYCSGVDPTITHFTKVSVTTKDKCNVFKWVKGVQRNVHEHDVRGLVLKDNKLISVSADGYIALSSYPPKWLMRVPPMLPAPRVCTSARKKLILLRYADYLEVWKLGSQGTTESEQRLYSNINDKDDKNTSKSNQNIEQDSVLSMVNFAKSPRKVVRLKQLPVKILSLKAKGGAQIKCCALSPDGQYVLYATDAVVRLFKLHLTEEEDANKSASLSKVKLSVESMRSCHGAAFAPDSRTLLLHDARSIAVVHIDDEYGVSLAHTINTAKYLKSSILRLKVFPAAASGAVYVAASDCGGGVATWARRGAGGVFVPHASLPRHHCVAAAFGLHPTHESLLVVYTDQTVVDYDLARLKFNAWSATEDLKLWLNRRAAFQDLVFHPRNPDAVIFCDNESLWIVDRKPTVQDVLEPVVKRFNQKKKRNSVSSLTVLPMKYLASFDWLDIDEAVAVEVLPENIILQLPPVLATKRFHGTFRK